MPVEFYAACEGYMEKDEDFAKVIRFASFRVAESMAGSKAIGSIEKFWPMDKNEEKKIYILQDCTFSIKRYEQQLRTIKAFILDEAFKHDYDVEWLFISDRINHRVSYNRANISSIVMNFR